MKFLDPISTETKASFIVSLILRLLIPILVGGVTIQFAIGARKFAISIKADLARIEKKLQQVERQNPYLASPVPFPRTDGSTIDK